MRHEPRSTFMYVTYIRTTPAKLWTALTDPKFIKQYWFNMRIESDWKVGSPWKMERADGSLTDSGEILEAKRPRRLVIKWRNEWSPEMKAEGYTRCTMELEREGRVVKLSVTHEAERENAKIIHAVSGGWPKILSNLKSLLETGETAIPGSH